VICTQFSLVIKFNYLFLSRTLHCQMFSFGILSSWRVGVTTRTCNSLRNDRGVGIRKLGTVSEMGAVPTYDPSLHMATAGPSKFCPPPHTTQLRFILTLPRVSPGELTYQILSILQILKIGEHKQRGSNVNVSFSWKIF
jgi:hypothetical protein